MKWEPADVIRLVALIGAFFLSALGAYMMWRGIAAEGAVDIKSSVLSGSVKTGSAGLFIVFFAFGIILFVLASLSSKAAQANMSPAKSRSKTHQLAWAFWGVLASLVVSGTLGALGYGAGFGGLAFFLGFMLIVVGGAYVVFLEAE